MCNPPPGTFFVTLPCNKSKVMMKNKISETPYIKAAYSECIACWKCVEACPEHVLGKVKFLWHKHAKIIAPDKCIGCGKCAAACPQHLFELKKR